MTQLKSWLAGLFRVFDLITFSPSSGDHGLQQLPLQPSAVQPWTVRPDAGPIFRPPNSSGNFKCDYTQEVGWESCYSAQNRSCWLRGPDGKEFNIHTNYEMLAPKGTLRQYELYVDEKVLHPDGFKMLHGKVFNGAYPGPWIEACWGDEIEIKVTNLLKSNGTTIHWHGIRQNGTLDMDGVNGVTQCPIATNDSFTYKFKATQYGTSWYHSHYSLQYADGMLGPMTIYGPSSTEYDEAKEPILMTDWSHRSAFQDFYLEMGGKNGPPKMTSALMNGRGSYTCDNEEIKAGNCTTAPAKYSTSFKKGKKYLLRLINTSVDSTWIFSIDNHVLQIVGADFVPIEPYTKNHVLVGIGQRYHVIVEATNPLPVDNYWIRMTVADGCSGFGSHANGTRKIPDDRLGILRYDESSKEDPNTKSNVFGRTCKDEDYENLKPVLKWKVGKPSNEQEYNTFGVGFSDKSPRAPWGNISRWELGKKPLWLDFANPTILNIGKNKQWDKDEKLEDLVVIAETNADTPESWIYLLITATKFPFSGTPSRFNPSAHPLHLHGHDFAILKQSTTPYWDGLVDMTFDNPPRRDVVLLPKGGYLIIAFRADNPGSWLLHCHIAWHASSGLAMQIMERERDIMKTITPERKTETDRICKGWNEWLAKNKHFEQDDSGI